MTHQPPSTHTHSNLPHPPRLLHSICSWPRGQWPREAGTPPVLTLRSNSKKTWQSSLNSTPPRPDWESAPVLRRKPLPSVIIPPLCAHWAPAGGHAKTERGHSSEGTRGSPRPTCSPPSDGPPPQRTDQAGAVWGMNGLLCGRRQQQGNNLVATEFQDPQLRQHLPTIASPLQGAERGPWGLIHKALDRSPAEALISTWQMLPGPPPAKRAEGSYAPAVGF